MCTVTIVPHERGVRLLCNRDERRTRPAALPPRIHTLGDRRAIFPVDPQGGGTWVGVNDRGLIVAILNLHLVSFEGPALRIGTWESGVGSSVVSGLRCSMLGHGAMRPARSVGSKNASQARRAAEALIRQWPTNHPDAQPIGRRPADYPSRSGHRQTIAGDAFFRASGRGAVARYAAAQGVPLRRDVGSRKWFRSRGLIVNALLRCRTLSDAAETLSAVDPNTFQPFRVVMVHNGEIAVAASTGNASIQSAFQPLNEPRLFTSSSLGDALVEPPRRRLFEWLVMRGQSGWLRGQARFHDHQWSCQPEISVRMERDDALTVSRTTIDITAGIPRLVYDTHPWCSWH